MTGFIIVLHSLFTIHYSPFTIHDSRFPPPAHWAKRSSPIHQKKLFKKRGINWLKRPEIGLKGDRPAFPIFKFLFSTTCAYLKTPNMVSKGYFRFPRASNNFLTNQN